MTRDESAAGGAGQVTSGQEPAGASVPFDTSRAHMARVYDFWLGGKDNFAADRAVAEQVAAAYPDIRIADRAAVGQQHAPGRAGGGGGVPGGVRGQRPDRAQPRPYPADQQPRGGDGL